MSEIRIGVLATLVGPFAVMGEDGIRGVQLAVDEFGSEVAGNPIKLMIEKTLVDPTIAEQKALKLLLEDRADMIVGPLSGNEGLRMKEVARRYPGKTFLNGSSGAQELTTLEPTPNFYNFALNGAQLMAGLGSYVVNTLGYRRVAVIAEDYSYPYAQVGGFMVEFCRGGGRVVEKHWVPVMTTNYRSVIAELSPDIDALYLALGGTDAIQCLNQLAEMNYNKPIIGGTLIGEQYVLSSREYDASRLVGVVTSSATADDNPNALWQAFVAAYRKKFKDGFNYPSYFALCYYLNMKALLLALQEAKADLSNGQKAVKTILGNLSFEGPSGMVRLDQNRGAISTVYIGQIAQQADGVVYRKQIQVVPDVTPTLGMKEADYLALGSFNRDNPSCP